MDQSTVSAAVAQFTQARVSMKPIATLTDDARPDDLESAYAIQDACIQAWGKDVIGWKVGATNPAALELFGLEEAFLGPIFAGSVFDTPVQLKTADFHHCCVESEFAFRLGADLPARDTPYTHDELRTAIAEVIPVFELISPRFTGVPKGDGAGAIADCGVGGGLVLGKPHKGMGGLDLVSHNVTLTVGGKQVAAGTGALVMEDPLNALQWTASKLASLGKSLHSGEIITTGTCTGVTFVEPGQQCIADFGPLGTVEATFA